MTNSSLQRGFSLLEIVAVVFLIAIIATSSIVVFSTGGPEKTLRRELEQFVNYSRQLSDLSILTGEPIGLVLTPPAWAENPLDTKGWSYTWLRYVEVPSEQQSPAAASAEGAQDPDAEQQAPLGPPPATVGQWMSIDQVQTVEFDEDIRLYVNIEGSDWDWNSTPKTDAPIFILFPTGEAEPFLFEIEFAHRNADLVEPQNVKFDETGRLQWVEAREALAELQDQYQ